MDITDNKNTNCCNLPSSSLLIIFFNLIGAFGIIVSSVGIVMLMMSDQIKFLIAYSIGNICMATVIIYYRCADQHKYILVLHKTIATMIFLLSILLVFVLGLILNPGVCLFFFGTQIGAYVWLSTIFIMTETQNITPPVL